MTSHSERSHAVLSPSGANRWVECTASARLEEKLPDSSSTAAKEGTYAYRDYFLERFNAVKAKDPKAILFIEEVAEAYKAEFAELELTVKPLGAPTVVDESDKRSEIEGRQNPQDAFSSDLIDD